ncbi:MAG: DUF805 domain-containing protein [Ignavibacteria bacterium]|nr:DUF805 domain-containing protein [Ignavibacteria bacterium]
MTQEELPLFTPFTLKPFTWQGKWRRLRRINRQSYTIMIALGMLGIITIILVNLILISQYILPSRNPLLIFAFIALGTQSLFTIILGTIGRLRDLDASPFWLLMVFISPLNLIFILVLMFLKGNPQPNQYGPHPISISELRRRRKGLY